MFSNEKESELSRREFIKTTGAIGVGSVLAAAGVLSGKTDTAETTEKPPEAPKVPTHSFGRTGVLVSTLCLGGIFDTINNQLLLKQALKWGVTYWDTANGYGGGNSELGFGKFFASNPGPVRKSSW